MSAPFPKPETDPVTSPPLAVMREAPLSILDARFGGHADGITENDDAWTALQAHVGGYGADVLFPPGKYMFASDPVISKPGIRWRGAGAAEINVGKVIAQADDFKARDLKVTARAGAGSNARLFCIDPVGAGRALSHFAFEDISFVDGFYAIDFRGSASLGISDVYCANLASDRTDGMNAGHFNFFYCGDVTTVGLGSHGGQNAASQNFFGGGGRVSVLGGNDENNLLSGGALNFENFFASAKVTVQGGQWGWGAAAGEDGYAITADDVEDITLDGVDCGGYVRVTTSTGVVKRIRILNSMMTRFKAESTAGTGGPPQTIDDLLIAACTMRGVPGAAQAYGMYFDGTYVRTARVLSCLIKRFAEDGVTENWSSGAMGVTRGAGLVLDVDDTDFDTKNMVVSGAGGIINFYQSNKNFAAQTSLPVPVRTHPLRHKTGAPSDADYDATRTGMQALDTAGMRQFTRVAGSDWRAAQLTREALIPTLVAPDGVDPTQITALQPMQAPNQPRAVRVKTRRGGTLHDLAAFVGVTGGNCRGAIYDTGDASTGVRTKLWDSGSVAVGVANTWQIIGDPALPVEAGEELEFLLMADGVIATFGRGGLLTNGNAALLPTGFLAVPGAVTPKKAWSISAFGSFAFPATIADGSLLSTTIPHCLIARIA